MAGMAEIPRVVDGSTKFTNWAAKYPRSALFAVRNRLFKLDLFGKKDDPPQALPPEFEELLGKLASSVSEIDDNVVESTKILGVLTANDNDILSPIYLAKSPFIRLQLRDFRADSRLLADDTVLATLVLHRSGVALITFYVVAGNERSTDDLIELSRPPKLKLDTCTFPGTVVGAAELEHEADLDEWVEPNIGNVPDRKIRWKGHFSITDAYFIYQNRIGWMAGGRKGASDYFCYATVVAGGLHCCRDKKTWLKSHTAELAGIAMRFAAYDGLSVKTVEKNLDSSITLFESESRFYYGGNAFILDWDFSPTGALSPDFTGLVSTVSVIEHAILQYWQIHSLDHSLPIGPNTFKHLLNVQRRLAEGIEEYRASALSYGTTREIAKSILVQLEANELHQRLLERSNMMQQLISAQQVRASVRRNYIVAGIGSAATVLLGIPALRDSLGLISQWKPPTFIQPIADPVIEWAKNGPSSVMALYAGALTLLVTILFVSFAIRLPKGRNSTKVNPGMEWSPMSPQWSMSDQRYAHGIPEWADDDS